MLLDLALVSSGLVLLIFAGDALVRGAVSLALKLGIPALIVSLTVVAFGTSAPELLVAIQSALEGAPGIAFGNVVGSNIANVLLVLGLPALIAAIDTSTSDMRSYLMMLAISVLFIILCFMGSFGPIQGAVLLVLLVLVILDAIRSAHRSRKDAAAVVEVEEGDANMSGRSIALYLGAGIIGLPIGAHLLIEGAVTIARDLNVSETVIGLTIVAVGTSLPELATSVMAAIKRQSEVALGNVVGSNLFNILAIMGFASFFGPLAVPPELLALDLWVMLAAALIIFPFAYYRLAISRGWGIAFVGAYSLYVGALIL